MNEIKDLESAAPCSACGEHTKHELSGRPWCGSTTCYFVIVNQKDDEDAEQQEEV